MMTAYKHSLRFLRQHHKRETDAELIDILREKLCGGLTPKAVATLEVSNLLVSEFLHSREEYVKYEEGDMGAIMQCAFNCGTYLEGTDDVLKLVANAQLAVWSQHRYCASLFGDNNNVRAQMERGCCCLYCGKVERYDQRMQRCGRCRQVFYCDKTCQQSDWYRHKALCQSTTTSKERPKGMSSLVPLLSQLRITVDEHRTNQFYKAQPYRGYLAITCKARPYIITMNPAWIVTDYNTRGYINSCASLEEVQETLECLSTEKPVIKSAECMKMCETIHGGTMSCKQKTCECLQLLYVDHIPNYWDFVR